MAKPHVCADNTEYIGVENGVSAQILLYENERERELGTLSSLSSLRSHPLIVAAQQTGAGMIDPAPDRGEKPQASASSANPLQLEG